ncbi:twin-arginine translocation signal domain-containing protein [Escherichia coli]
MAKQQIDDLNEPSRRRLLKGIGALGGALDFGRLSDGARGESQRRTSG